MRLVNPSTFPSSASIVLQVITPVARHGPINHH